MPQMDTHTTAILRLADCALPPSPPLRTRPQLAVSGTSTLSGTVRGVGRRGSLWLHAWYKARGTGS